ncbi:hypothetical protein D3C76_1234920 [compost metagenome]
MIVAQHLNQAPVCQAVMHIPPRAQQDPAPIQTPLVRHLTMVARQAAGHPHALLAIGPFQLPDAERMVALLDHQAIMAAQLSQYFRRTTPRQIGR